MRAFEKFVVCLALLLVALATAFVRPLPALAVWGDDDEPLPEVLGMQLGGDIRQSPDLERYWTEDIDLPENQSKEAKYEGISAYPMFRDVRDYKISRVSFHIKVKDFPRFRKIMRRKFGNEIFRGYGEHLHSGYYWGKYEVEVWANYPVEGDMVQIIFSYLPLENLDNVDFFRIQDSFAYHGVTLGQKAEEYPFLHPIKEEAPGIVYYQSDEPPLNYDGDARYWRPERVESETWLAYQGVIYSLELRGDKSEDYFMSSQLMDMYKPKRYSNRVYSSPEVRLGDYTIYFNKPGLAVMIHMPTYWRILRAKMKLGK